MASSAEDTVLKQSLRPRLEKFGAGVEAEGMEDGGARLVENGDNSFI